ncbi:MAG: extracellular solute-binding protein, partial [Isosphaeraceae bacterium]|nr:extracellular solute-binding protein [Isosphaeraceae bacterium]
MRGRGRGAGGWLLAIAALVAPGCTSKPAAPAASERPYQGVTLKVVAVGDPGLADAIASQSGEWKETHGADLSFSSGAIDPKQAREADVVLFPGDRLGALVDARALAVLPEPALRPPAPRKAEDGAAAPEPSRDVLAFADIAEAYRDQVSKYGDEHLALPLGGSALVLVYRRDALASEENRKAAREAGIALEPPTTWEDLDALARFLQGRDWDEDGQPESGIALAWGADPEGVGNTIFLSRAAALGQHPNHYSFLFDSDTMEPRIASPPFVEALNALVQLKDSGPAEAETFDAEAARAAFRSGEVALLIDRAERAARWTDPKAPISAGVARLPGSTRVYDPGRQVWETLAEPNRPSYLPHGGGWLVGISATLSGTKRTAALDWLRDLAGPETSARLQAERSSPMLPVRPSALASGLPDSRSAPGVEPRSWGRAVAETLTAPRVVVGLRIPDAESYLADLDGPRAAAAAGEPAERALRTVAQAWSDRTARWGVERQLWHYRRSLNRLPT